MVSIVVNRDYELEQLDVKTVFQHGNLDEKILMDQPEGYVKPDDENKVCFLRKFLYGLKQSPRQWNIRFDTFMKKKKFLQSHYDSCVYIRNVNTPKAIYLMLYVDYMLIALGDKTEVQIMKDSLSREFEMKDLGRASRILGMDIVRDRKKGTLVLSQEAYIKKVLKSFGMEDSKPVTTPLATQFKLKSRTKAEALEQAAKMEEVPYASAVGSLMCAMGSLMYAMIGSRPDLAHAVGVVSRFMFKPGMDHWQAVKWTLKYLRGESKTSLTFVKISVCSIERFSYSDYSASLDRRRSVTGCVFKFWGNTVSWRSNLQSVVALLTTEAEYMALSTSTK